MLIGQLPTEAKQKISSIQSWSLDIKFDIYQIKFSLQKWVFSPFPFIVG